MPSGPSGAGSLEPTPLAFISSGGRWSASAPLEEYRKDSPTWKTYPSAMIVKVAEALSLKRQFGISGLVTAEEIGGASEAPETTRAGKTPTQMTSVVKLVHGPVVECPPTAAGSPDPIS